MVLVVVFMVIYSAYFFFGCATTMPDRQQVGEVVKMLPEGAGAQSERGEINYWFSDQEGECLTTLAPERVYDTFPNLKLPGKTTLPAALQLGCYPHGAPHKASIFEDRGPDGVVDSGPGDDPQSGFEDALERLYQSLKKDIRSRVGPPLPPKALPPKPISLNEIERRRPRR